MTNKARKIGTTLRKIVPSLPHVGGAFLLTRTPSKVKPLVSRNVRGVRFYTLKDWKRAIDFDAPTGLSSRQLIRLGHALEPKIAVAMHGSLRRLAGYVNLELQTPKEQRFHRIYKGVHSARQDRVTLHLYDLSASGVTNGEVKSQREHKALHRLQLYAWAPRILDSYQAAPGYAGEMYFFTVVDPAAPSIKKRASDESWGAKARLAFARNAVRALGELHNVTADGEPMVHRNLTPQTILVKHDNSPILIGFERTKIPSDISVASGAASTKKGYEAAAPEVRAQGLGAADHRSDVYSLCACLAGLFRELDDRISQQVMNLLDGGMAKEPGVRSTLQDLETALAALLGESIPELPPPPARFWTEDQVVPFRGYNYRIISRLGSGGVGTTFKVVKIGTEGDIGTYVAKVVRDEETGKRVLEAYELAHSHLRHSALSTIFEVALKWQDNSFVALMSWIEGKPLSEYAGLLPRLAEDFQEESGEALAVRWLRTACEALDMLHRNGLVHGDVSPRNMIVCGGDLVLTDYDFVGKIGKPVVKPGTILYCSPSYLEDRPAAGADDIYALAASFFQVLFEKKPFQYDGHQAKERGLNWESVERDQYPTVAGFLDLATDPDPKQRFATAADALTILSPSERVEPEPEQAERSENEVSWLKSLLESYPGSLWGNRETRGLDTDFAAQTYVETKLEQVLCRDILERRISLVILCGNAGDGKTALLQHLSQHLGLGDYKSATRVLEGRRDDGLTICMNLDGSASWKGRSADELLDEFLAPFQQGRPSADIVHLLAINDGRLLEWIEDFEYRSGETPLTNDLSNLLESQRSSSESHIRFVNLNERSLVGGIATDTKRIDTSFLGRLVDNLYGGERAKEIWAPCQTCSAQERCEVFQATRIFGPDGIPGAGAAARIRAGQRLFEALQAVHLRGETHITIRELRATLVYILFGIHFCRDYHTGDSGFGLSHPQSYSDRAFAPESPGRQGEVLRELVRFDPALEAHPQIDRNLLHPPPSDEDRSVTRSAGLTLASARRRAYFEWPKEHIERLTRDRYALDLAQGRHLREFRDLAIDKTASEREALVKRLCGGISRLEVLPPQALKRPDVVPLRITPRTPTETAFWVEKSVRDFHLEADITGDWEGLDRLHRQAFLIYRYCDGQQERLRLGAELFHLLLELSEGYQLGDVSTDDTFAHLSIFVQRLVRENDRRLFAWNPMREETIFEISARVTDVGSQLRQDLVIAPLEMAELHAK